MWLLFFALPLVIVMIVGGLLAGGIFTIVFIPLAAIIIAGTIIYLMWGKATERENIPGERESVEPLPHTHHSNAASAPTQPDELVNARQGQQ